MPKPTLNRSSLAALSAASILLLSACAGGNPDEAGTAVPPTPEPPPVVESIVEAPAAALTGPFGVVPVPGGALQLLSGSHLGYDYSVDLGSHQLWFNRADATLAEDTLTAQGATSRAHLARVTAAAGVSVRVLTIRQGVMYAKDGQALTERAFGPGSLHPSAVTMTLTPETTAPGAAAIGDWKCVAKQNDLPAGAELPAGYITPNVSGTAEVTLRADSLDFHPRLSVQYGATTFSVQDPVLGRKYGETTVAEAAAGGSYYLHQTVLAPTMLAADKLMLVHIWQYAPDRSQQYVNMVAGSATFVCVRPTQELPPAQDPPPQAPVTDPGPGLPPPATLPPPPQPCPTGTVRSPQNPAVCIPVSQPPAPGEKPPTEDPGEPAPRWAEIRAGMGGLDGMFGAVLLLQGDTADEVKHPAGREWPDLLHALRPGSGNTDQYADYPGNSGGDTFREIGVEFYKRTSDDSGADVANLKSEVFNQTLAVAEVQSSLITDKAGKLVVSSRYRGPGLWYASTRLQVPTKEQAYSCEVIRTLGVRQGSGESPVRAGAVLRGTASLVISGNSNVGRMKDWLSIQFSPSMMLEFGGDELPLTNAFTSASVARDTSAGSPYSYDGWDSDLLETARVLALPGSEVTQKKNDEEIKYRDVAVLFKVAGFHGAAVARCTR